jgi:hypothetical protein
MLYFCFPFSGVYDKRCIHTQNSIKCNRHMSIQKDLLMGRVSPHARSAQLSFSFLGLPSMHGRRRRVLLGHNQCNAVRQGPWPRDIKLSSGIQSFGISPLLHGPKQHTRSKGVGQLQEQQPRSTCCATRKREALQVAPAQPRRPLPPQHRK